ncbi:serine hydrolase [Ramlibacter sp. AN1015]|uniref:serine hydrolase n=1 Tax=Ramlibacter sp. AN1015 TaxID=3133428 RepID=UPI0030BAA9A4
MTKQLKRFVHVVATALILAGFVPVEASAATSQRPVAKKKQATVKAKPKRVSRSVVRQRAVAPSAAVAPRLSYGQLAGLHSTEDQLDLASSVALVIDQDTREVLLSKNQTAVLPIASLTKLMTGIVISEAKLPMDEVITITQDDVDTEKWSGSRLRVGAQLTRAEALHLALMSSENRAAHALGRTFPGGLPLFVDLMNAKARQLGMATSTFVEPTGLSSRNQSSASDLALLVTAAASDPLLREYSTSTGYQVAVGKQTLQYKNTNRLVKNPDWDIGLQKTGYISEAGQCLVMQAQVAGRKLIMVFLDSAGKLSRIADAERVRRWVEVHSPAASTGIQLGRQGG